MPFRCVLLAALLCAGAAARPEEPRLVRKWEKILGAPGATPWLTAVCPNGVFYAVDGRGRAVALNADGDMIAESEGERALFRVRALACDSDNLLYAARTDNIAVLRAAANRFETVREARPEVDIYAMTIGARGRIYAAGRRPGSRLPLHVLEPDGRVLLSFGERQRGQVYPPFQPQSLLLWQKRPERLLVVGSAPYQIQAYGPDGVLLDVVRPRYRSFIRPAQFTPGGDITGAAVLPHGQVIVQLRSYGPWRTDAPDTVLDLHDSEFRIIARDVPALPGVLAGASSKGGLYFFDTRRRASLTKAELKGKAAATRVLAWNYEVFRVGFCCPVRHYRGGIWKSTWLKRCRRGATTPTCTSSTWPPVPSASTNPSSRAPPRASRWAWACA